MWHVSIFGLPPPLRGAFADVYPAKSKLTKEIIALKEFRVFDEMSSAEEQAAMMEACDQELSAMLLVSAHWSLHTSG